MIAFLLTPVAIVLLILLTHKKDRSDDGPLTLADVRGRLPVTELGHAMDPRMTETALALYPAPRNRCTGCGALFDPLFAEAECFDCRHPHVGVVEALRVLPMRKGA